MNKIRNPVLRGFNPDPSMVRAGEDYYIATSTFEWFPGVAIHHSRDLVHWRLAGHALTRVSQLDLAGSPCSSGVWAPCLSFCDGLFYLVFTDVKNGGGGFVDGNNYLVTAQKVTGPWSEPVYLNSSGFDPSLFHDDDGRKWFLNMRWNHRSDNKSGGILLQEYDPVEKKLVGESELIFKGTEAGGTEAAHLYRRGGYYHLMTAEGGTWYGHVVTMARSRDLHGPYELDPGNPILTSRDDESLPLQKAGHASLVHTQTDEWYIAFLCGRPLPGTRDCPLGRETSLAKCFWNEEGWLRVEGGNHPSLEVDAPALPPHPFPRVPVRDDFDGALNLLTLRRPPDPAWLSLTERPGFLRMKGRASPASRFGQSLVARRLQAFKAEAVTRVEFEPENDQQMAGLICLYNDRNFVYLRISRDEAGVNAGIIQLDKGKMLITEPVPVNKNCHLKVRFDTDHFQFHLSRDGKEWSPVGEAYETRKLSDEYCRGFTGAFIGLCVQDMSSRSNHADFDFFEYREFHDE